MARRIPTSVTVTEVLAATPEQVWAVVADPTRIGEWSGECRSGEWLDGANQMAPGARFRGHNQLGWLRWSRPCTVIEAEPDRRLVFETKGLLDSTRWIIALTPEGSGTSVRLGYEQVRMARALEVVVVRAMPSHLDRSADLRRDLSRLEAAATRAVG